MKKSEQANRVRALSDYLAGSGHPVSSVQGHEILARALGLKNKHVLASLAKNAAKVSAPGVPVEVVIDGEVVPVRPLGAAPYSVAEMQAMDWEFDVVIPVALDDLTDQDKLNEVASEFITGVDYALEDLAFEHVPEVCYGKDYVAYRVTAYVSSPADIWDEVEAEDDAQFYAGLNELAGALQNDLPVRVKVGTNHQPRVARAVDTTLLALLKAYAQTAGANNDQVNAHYNDVVVELHPRDDSLAQQDRFVVRVTLGDLKYATKGGDALWNVCIGRDPGVLVELTLHA
jgi:hypothetical protein